MRISFFKEEHQDGIDKMMKAISNEFQAPISNGFKSVVPVYDRHWIAQNGKEIIGTVSVLKCDKNSAVLKNMFVKSEYRGRDHGTAYLLLKEVFEWSNAENLSQIYLGTMTQFKAAHKFYEKHGFEQINPDSLPQCFNRNPVDDVFYRKVLHSA